MDSAAYPYSPPTDMDSAIHPYTAHPPANYNITGNSPANQQPVVYTCSNPVNLEYNHTQSANQQVDDSQDRQYPSANQQPVNSQSESRPSVHHNQESTPVDNVEQPIQAPR